MNEYLDRIIEQIAVEANSASGGVIPVSASKAVMWELLRRLDEHDLEIYAIEKRRIKEKAMDRLIAETSDLE